MFGANVPTKLELVLEHAISELKHHPIGSDDYMRALEVVIKLHRLTEEEKPSKVSKDTMAVVLGNLLGIIMIIRHEHVNVIATRAMGLLLKPR